MTRKWTKDYDESDADIRVDANGTVSTQCPSSQDKELLLVCREESTVLQEGAAPASPSFLVQNPKPTAGGWALGVLGLIVLVAVTPVARGGTARALKEPQVAITDAADWIGMLPQDVVSHLDTQVNPCDDLYAFSCGSWLKQAEVPDDGARVSLFYSQVIDENREVLKEVMEQGWPLVGELYESCMNFSDTSCKTDDETSVAILSPTIAQIAATTSKSDFFRLAGTVSKTGPSFLTEIGVGPDAREVTVLTLHASQTGISLPDPQYYLDPKQFGSIRDAFHAYIVKLFTLVGYEPHVAALQASSVIDFEQALASLFVPREKLQDPVASYNRMSVAQASEKYPLLLGQTMNGRGTLATLLARNASLIVTTPAFFERAERFVSGDAVTLDALKAVLTYRYIGAWANLLSESFVQARFSFFQQTLQGQNTREARWMFCLQSVYSFFPDLTGKYFALRRFDEATEQLAKQFVTRIQASLQRDLTQVDWLDGPTRQAALEKLGNMTNLIGYSNLSDFPYELRSDAPFIENVQAIMEDMFERGVAQIGGRVDRSKWAVSGAEVNAFYQPTANRMVFPAGILQPPFFARDQHPARNFGAIGHIIGHELTHGFDASGRLFAFDGNLQDWWSNATATEFLHRADCLVRQYNAFAVTNSSNRDKVLGYVNGQLTLSENIADTGGMKLAYHAYQTYVADRSKAPSNVNDGESTSTSTSQAEHSLPADVADKLFFIAFAQGHCSKWSDAATAEKLLTDPHSPGQWRANGVASNSHDFARVFSCPAGSPMNPTTKCQLW